MNLCIKKVEGIDEPVKLISGSGFAVGARTNKVFVWHVGLNVQVQTGTDAEVEESKFSQIITLPTLTLAAAKEVPYSENNQASLEFVEIKATQMQTALLTADGRLCIIDHK